MDFHDQNFGCKTVKRHIYDRHLLSLEILSVYK